MPCFRGSDFSGANRRERIGRVDSRGSDGASPDRKATFVWSLRNRKRSFVVGFSYGL
jgi:hypothetical protein